MKKVPRYIMTVSISQDLEDKMQLIRASGINTSALMRTLFSNYCDANPQLFVDQSKQTENSLVSKEDANA